MRTPNRYLWSLLAVLPACAATPSIGSLPALDARRVTDAEPEVLAPAAADASAAPEPAAAIEPEPPATADRAPRREKRLFFYTTFSFAAGEYDYSDEGIGRDDTLGTVFRFQFGGGNREGTGLGMDLKFLSTGDEVYDDTLAEADVRQTDCYFFAMGHLATERFRLPVRFGPYFHEVRIEFDPSELRTDYEGIGFRAEFEPEIVLVATDADTELSLVGLLSGGLLVAEVEDDLTGQEYDSDGYTLRAELGMRMRHRQVAFGAAIVHDHHVVEESDLEAAGRFPELETEFTGLQFTFGLRF